MLIVANYDFPDLYTHQEWNLIRQKELYASEPHNHQYYHHRYVNPEEPECNLCSPAEGYFGYVYFIMDLNLLPA